MEDKISMSDLLLSYFTLFLKSPRIERKIRTLSKEESDAIGIQIESLMKNEMLYIVNKYIRQFTKAAYDVFGWTKEDLQQQVRIAFWRGLATYDKTKGAKVTTYLSVILFHYFMSFSKKCKSSRNSEAKLYPVEEIYETYDEYNKPIGVDDKIHWEESVQYLMAKLSDKEKMIIRYYAGEETGINRIAMDSGIPKTQVAKTIKSIRTKIISHYRELEDEEEYIHYDDIGDTTHDDLEEFDSQRVLVTKKR